MDGQPNTTAAPNTLGMAEALINLASAGNHTIAFSYPGDSINPASNGNTMVTIVATGSVLPNESTVYQFSITKPDGSSGYAPNGTVLGYADSVNGNWSQINYDGLNRLISAQVTPALNGTQTTNLCWAYDSFGNRTSQIQSNQPISGDGTYCSPQSPSTATWSGTNTVYTALNQIDHNVDPGTQMNLGSPVQYDPSGAGNVVTDGLTGGNPREYLYDAEGRVCAVQLQPVIAGMPNRIIRYLYDAEGNRIGKGTTTEWSCNGDDSDTFSLTNEYVVGQGGEQVTEFDGNGNRLHTNAYAGGQLIATYDFTLPVVALHYHLADWLGTQRLQVSPAGAVEEAWQSLPFGEFAPSNDQVALGVTEHHFTGKERDTESGLDYFGARYYGSTMGRFMSPDWSAKIEPVPYSKLDNPQSLNLYAYVGNNPLSLVDSDGHEGDQVVCAGNSNCHTVDDKIRGGKEAQLQVGQDPTLPTEVAPPPPSLVDRIGDALFPKTWGDIASLALAIPTDGLLEGAAPLARGLGLSMKLTEEGASDAEKVAKITEEADKLYPSKAGKFEAHHNMPQGLGGPKNGPTTRLPASYHQMITNMTRTLTKNYTDFSAGAKATMDKVYSYFPISW